MPPKRKQRQSKTVEDVERQKKMLSTKEKILKMKRMLLSVIETSIEKDVSKEWFLANCTKLCHADYSDIVQERSIENLCGYPLCSNIIKQTLKQKYRISRATNKVYDLTERKCFCSNHCYKASNYLKAQLSPIPLYMRKEENIVVHLLSDCDNRGSAGEEIVFHHKISEDEIYKVFNEEENVNNLQNMLNEEIKKCSDSLGELQIKEHVYEKQYVFGDESSREPSSSTCNNKSDSDSDKYVDSDDSEDEKLFPSYDNTSVLSQKHMPIPSRIKKSVLIPPLNSVMNKSSPVQELSLDFVTNVFKDWITEDTLKYLMGEKHVYGIKAEHLFERMTESEPCNSDKLASIKNEYIQLCLKIDSLPDDDDYVSDSNELDSVNKSNTKKNSQNLESENNLSKRVFKRRPRKSKEKYKHVTFAPEPKQEELQTVKAKSSNEEKVEHQENIIKTVNENAELQTEENECHMKEEGALANKDETEKEPPTEMLPEPKLPLVDSLSQNMLRRQVLTSKLKSVYTELLPIAGLHYKDIRDAVRKFVESLSLTPTNIIFKPKEWRLISLVLFRILTRTVLKDIHDELQFAKLCENPLIPITIDLKVIENLVCDIISVENVINIH